MLKIEVPTWPEGSDPELWDAMVHMYEDGHEPVEIFVSVEDTGMTNHVVYDGETFVTDNGRFHKSMVGY